MIISEFKAWLEGYTEAMTAPPNAEQWARICQKLAELNTPTVGLPDYLRQWPHGIQGMSQTNSGYNSADWRKNDVVGMNGEVCPSVFMSGVSLPDM